MWGLGREREAVYYCATQSRLRRDFRVALTAWKRLPARLKWSSKEQQTPAQEQLEATKASKEPRAATMQVRGVQKVVDSGDPRRFSSMKKPQEYEHTVHTQPEPDMMCSYGFPPYCLEREACHFVWAVLSESSCISTHVCLVGC